VEAFPDLETNYPSSLLKGSAPADWAALLEGLDMDRSVDLGDEIDCLPGEAQGREMVLRFIDGPRLKLYGEKRNDPNCDAVSHLSPYFNFGHVSVQRVVMQVRQSKRHPSSADTFIEEAVVRRELSDNFCYFNANYDSLAGCYPWAAETLRVHAADSRQYLYSLQQLERSETHDDLWNAAQRQLVRTGKMHGFLRMYWAKKV
jgi:deoxyribodipyrimidine photo-lyase